MALAGSKSDRCVAEVRPGLRVLKEQTTPHLEEWCYRCRGSTRFEGTESCQWARMQGESVMWVKRVELGGGYRKKKSGDSCRERRRVREVGACGSSQKRV